MPDRTLTLTALVNSDVDATPPLADFGDIIVGQSGKKIVTLKNNMKSELKLEKLQFNEEFLEVNQVKENSEIKKQLSKQLGKMKTEYLQLIIKEYWNTLSQS